MNLRQIARSLTVGRALRRQNRLLERIADALDRAFPASEVARTPEKSTVRVLRVNHAAIGVAHALRTQGRAMGLSPEEIDRRVKSARRGVLPSEHHGGS